MQELWVWGNKQLTLPFCVVGLIYFVRCNRTKVIDCLISMRRRCLLYDEACRKKARRSMPHIGARIERSLGTDMRKWLFRGRGISKQYLTTLYHGGDVVRMDSPLALSAAILWGMHQPIPIPNFLTFPNYISTFTW